MMKRLPLIPLALLLAVLLAAVYMSQGWTSSGIIVTNADAMVDHGIVSNSELHTLISNVAEHIIIQFANANKDHSLPAIDSELLNLVAQVIDRIVIQFANINKQHVLGYPSDLIGDTTAPIASNVSIASFGSNGIRITWTTNEYATSVVGLGLAPGNYTQFVTDPLVNMQHEAIFTGLMSGDVVYIQIKSIDRSGNSSNVTSTFVVPLKVFLPIVIKQ